MEKKVSVTLYCPRCRGRLFRDKDEDGWHEQCIRCGFLRYLEAALPDRQAARPPEFHSGGQMRR